MWSVKKYISYHFTLKRSTTTQAFQINNNLLLLDLVLFLFILINITPIVICANEKNLHNDDGTTKSNSNNSTVSKLVTIYKCESDYYYSNSINGNKNESNESHKNKSSQLNKTHDSDNDNNDEDEVFTIPKYLIRTSSQQGNTSGLAELQFRLKSKDIYCSNGQFHHIIPISNSTQPYYHHVVQVVNPTIKEYQFQLNSIADDETIDDDDESLESHTTYFSSDGYLTIDSNHYHPNEYCLQRTNGSQILIHHNNETSAAQQQQFLYKNESIFIIVSVCHPNCTAKTPCLAKCCDLNEIWNDVNKSCMSIPKELLQSSSSSSTSTRATTIFNHNSSSPFTTTWAPQFYEPNEFDCLDDFNIEFIHLRKSLPNCTDGLDPIIYYGSEQFFRVLGNGTVTGRIPPADWKPLKTHGFCLDRVLRRGVDGKFTSFEQIMLACPGKVNTMRVKDSIAPIWVATLFTACLLLLSTALIYLVLWKTQNLHGWCIFCEVISMLLMILFVSGAHSLARDPDNGDYGSLHCVVIGACAHFFFLSTFFWLTVINADLWWNFRKLSPINKSTTNHSYRRFFLYLFASEIGPAIIIAIGLLLDETYGLKNGGLDCAELTVPNYGQTNCYLSKPAQGPYLFYPIGILLGCNLIFFSLTIFSMLEYQKGTQDILRGSSTNQTQSFTVVAKLFIVMGVSWIFEIVAWAINQPKNKSFGGSGYVPSYWIVFDLVSLVQSLAIFIIFICRQTVLTKLAGKFPCLQKLLKVFPNTNKNRRASSYHHSSTTGTGIGTTNNMAISFSRSSNNMMSRSGSSPSNNPNSNDNVRLGRMTSRTSSTFSTSIST